MRKGLEGGAVEFGLNSDERSAVILHYVAAYTAVEVAGTLGRPVGTVKALTYRARKKLAVLLADYQAARTSTSAREGMTWTSNSTPRTLTRRSMR